MRTATIDRTTKETSIQIEIGLDGSGKSDIATGVGFLDHMLDQVARHGLIDLKVRGKGDTHIDLHHLTEDSGIALGQALYQALGAKAGIVRYGAACIPLDEALCRVIVDLSDRPCLVWHVQLPTEKVGDMDSELFREWFQAFANSARATVHVECLYGENTHHIVEACYKALARALAQAVTVDPRRGGTIPSTKGTLGG